MSTPAPTPWHRSDALRWTATLALFATSLGGFTSIFTGSRWILSVLGCVVVLYVAIFVTRALTRRLPVFVSGLLSGLAGILLAGATLILMFAPGTALLGVVPTPLTFTAFGDLIETGSQQMTTGSAPLEPQTDFLFLIVVTGSLIALVMAALVLAAGLPMLAVLLALVTYAAPLLALPVGFNPLTFAALAVAVLLLLLVTRPLPREGSSARRIPPIALPLGAATVALTLVVTPPLTAAIAPNPVSIAGRAGPFQTGINPLISLGEDLRRGVSTVAMNYITTADSPPYVRVFTIDDLDRTLWQPRAFRADPRNSVNSFPAPPGLGPDIAVTPYATTFSMESLSTSWLPLTYPATSVSGLNGQWLWEEPGLSAYSAQSTTRAQRYTVQSLLVEPTAQQLRDAPAGADADVDPRYRSLPDDLPDNITTVMLKVLADANAETDYDRAVALERFFRSSFTYSESAPVQNGFNGTAGEVIGSFLDRRTGYCVHFASAMTVMARMLYIPARIAVGYLPGTIDHLTDDGDRVYRVASTDLHAWPELYFEGIGWTAFEPTASRGAPSAFREVSTTSPTDPATPTVAPTTAPTQASTSDPTPSATPSASATASAPPSSAGGIVVSPRAEFWTVLGVVMILILVLLLPLAARALQRAQRRRRGARTGRNAGAAWAEVLATAVDLGVPAGPGASPRAIAAHLTGISGQAAGQLDALAAAVEAESYARPGTGDISSERGRDTATPADAASSGGTQHSWRDAEHIVRELRASVPLSARLRALFFPRSLRWPRE
ncbi:hypothetical protein D9V32_07000 [Mycetocola tolaasinivorans]|uniref:Transglutaminase-like domain-containing protein n=1 Tax=Mycetocola tolaasinivorans TaxID=76635 RepID=A0A3L7A6V9_9MICO|nr:DUF3488 and transglutaminase-like domain-containing protein [Mycetocola tolaasinivorans]RLP75907.1 hypothetical protein D9V32_07000 [Mycetocola tolaasinivorans]